MDLFRDPMSPVLGPCQLFLPEGLLSLPQSGLAGISRNTSNCVFPLCTFPSESHMKLGLFEGKRKNRASWPQAPSWEKSVTLQEWRPTKSQRPLQGPEVNFRIEDVYRQWPTPQHATPHVTLPPSLGAPSYPCPSELPFRMWPLCLLWPPLCLHPERSHQRGT